jgi:hypothetical protein
VYGRLRQPKTRVEQTGLRPAAQPRPRYAKPKGSKGGMLMDKQIVVVTLFTVFLIAAILPRIIQKLKKVETVGCIGINRKLFFFGKISLFTSAVADEIRLKAYRYILALPPGG